MKHKRGGSDESENDEIRPSFIQMSDLDEKSLQNNERYESLPPSLNDENQNSDN